MWLSGEESAYQCRGCRRLRFYPWVGKISWRRKWQPTPVFLPGKSQGQGILASYSPWGPKESDMIEWLSTNLWPRTLNDEPEVAELDNALLWNQYYSTLNSKVPKISTMYLSFIKCAYEIINNNFGYMFSSIYYNSEMTNKLYYSFWDCNSVCQHWVY